MNTNIRTAIQQFIAANGPNAKLSVEKDLLLANQYGINGVPCLILDGKYQINGAQPLTQIIKAVRGVAESKEKIASEGAACRLDNGKINCD